MRKHPFTAIIYIANTHHGSLVVDGDDNIVAQSLEACSHYAEDILGVAAMQKLSELKAGLYRIKGYSRPAHEDVEFTITEHVRLWEKQ